MVRRPLKLLVVLAICMATFSFAPTAHALTEGSPCDLYTGRCQPDLSCYVFAFTPSYGRVDGMSGIYIGAWIQCNKPGVLTVEAQAVRDGTAGCGGSDFIDLLCSKVGMRYVTATGNTAYLSEWVPCDPLQTRKWRSVGSLHVRFDDGEINLVDWRSTLSPWIGCPL